MRNLSITAEEIEILFRTLDQEELSCDECGEIIEDGRLCRECNDRIFKEEQSELRGLRSIGY